MSDTPKKPFTPTTEAPLSQEEMLKKAIAAVAQEMIPAAIAAAVSASSRQAPVAPKAADAPLFSGVCSDCGQMKSACKGEHEKMVVFPLRYPEHANFFQGVVINGVKYLSNNAEHEVTVPKVAVAAIQNLVATFETNEQEMRLGRKAERRSGQVSPSGVSVTPATAAWR